MRARARRLRRHRRARRRTYVPRLGLLTELYLAEMQESAARWQAYFDKLHDELIRTVARALGVPIWERT